MARTLTEPKLGSGKRFEHLEEGLAHERGIRNPRALAAAIGRKKYGVKKMTKLAEKGKEREEKLEK